MDKGNPADEVGRAKPVRAWSVEAANARIRELGELLTELRSWVERLQLVQLELGRLHALRGGEIDARDLPARRHKDRLDQETDGLRRRSELTLSDLQEEGIEIKDLERGLVDFYARIDGELVYLCWRIGEEVVGYFHSLGAGFRGRRPVPRNR